MEVGRSGIHRRTPRRLVNKQYKSWYARACHKEQASWYVRLVSVSTVAQMKSTDLWGGQCAWDEPRCRNWTVTPCNRLKLLYIYRKIYGIFIYICRPRNCGFAVWKELYAIHNCSRTIIIIGSNVELPRVMNRFEIWNKSRYNIDYI